MKHSYGSFGNLYLVCPSLVVSFGTWISSSEYSQ